MNSINILTGISSSASSDSPGRSRSGSESLLSEKATRDVLKRSHSQNVIQTMTELPPHGEMAPIKQEEVDDAYPNGYTAPGTADEKTPLLDENHVETFDGPQSARKSIWLLPGSIAAAFVSAVRFVIAVVAAPGRFVIGCFYDQDGHFSALLPVLRLGRLLWVRDPVVAAQPVAAAPPSSVPSRQGTKKKSRSSRLKQSQSESSAAVTSESEAESHHPDDDTPARNTRSKSSSSASSEIIAPSKRSIRIKLSSDEALKQRKQRSRLMSSHLPEQPTTAEELAAAAMKSPTSPSTTGTTMTKYPRAPAPPRPLIPRRQPSYSNNPLSADIKHEKTLIIDLDETLIHSMSKGGRFTTGHMVEVRMRQSIGVGGITIGPEVPVLYYVHKRPHCDDFLRKVRCCISAYSECLLTHSRNRSANGIIS